jgi:DNA-directed RNA polymerase I, II, and III subunit RPABC1
MESDAERNFRILNTTYSMLELRGYAVDRVFNTISEFKTPFLIDGKECMTTMAQRNDQTSKTTIVYFVKAPKLGVGSLTNYCKDAIEIECRHIIFVVAENLTPFAKNEVVKLSRQLRIEHFTENNMLNNPVQHELVPCHVGLSKEKGELVKNRFGGLPYLPSSDPISRFMGFQKGQVIEIKRPSENGGFALYWRLVT